MEKSMSTTPVLTSTPASESSPYVIQEAVPGPAISELTGAEAARFSKAAAMLEKAWGGDSATPVAADSVASSDKPAPAAAPLEQNTDAVGRPEGEAPKVEAPKPPAEDPFAHKFDQLRREGQRLEQKRAEMKADLEELAKYRSAKGSAKVNLNAALETLGLTVDDVTRLALSGGQLSPEAQIALEAKQAAEKATSALEEQRKQYQEQQQQALLDNYRREASQF